MSRSTGNAVRKPSRGWPYFIFPKCNQSRLCPGSLKADGPCEHGEYDVHPIMSQEEFDSRHDAGEDPYAIVGDFHRRRAITYSTEPGFIWGRRTVLNMRAYGYDFGRFALVILLNPNKTVKPPPRDPGKPSS